MSMKVPKFKVSLTINFSGNIKLSGNIFLDLKSPLHYGEEMVIDLLNSNDYFFPFEIEETHRIKIINKKNIVSVTMRRDKKFDQIMGKKENITVSLYNSPNLTGELVIDQPEYKSRVLDYFNADKNQFFSLLTASETHYINSDYVLYVVPL